MVNDVLKKMKTFKRTSSLTKTVMAIIGNMLMPKEEWDRLNEIFKSMDTDGNGVLTKDEICEAVRKG